MSLFSSFASSAKRCFMTLLFLTSVPISAADNPFAVPENPFAPAKNTSSDTLTWMQTFEDQWRLSGDRLQSVEGQLGRTAGLICGKKLVTLGPDGTPDRQVLPLEKDYVLVGLRDKYVVAITDVPAAIEILDRKTAKVLRRTELGEGEPLSLALHPHRPVSYVSLSRKKAVTENFHLQGFFTVIDEETATVRPDDHVGQGLTIDPLGRFLVVSYSDKIKIGSKVVRIPGALQPRTVVPSRPIPGTPSRPIPGIPGRSTPRPGSPYGSTPIPGRPMPGTPQYGPDRYQVFTSIAALSLAAVYELDDDLNPECISVFEFPGSSRGLRLSFDGTRLTAIGEATTIATLQGRDPLKESLEPTTYDFRFFAPAIANVDLWHHPSTLLTAVASSNRIAFFNSSTGARLTNPDSVKLPTSATFTERCVSFSPDGRHLLVAVREKTSESFLMRIPLPLTTEDAKRISDRSKQGATTKAKVPLAKFDALRGGLAPSMRTSEIAKQFSDAVVVIRSGESTGTGFVVGSSGYIATCAHCVSQLRPTKVVYQQAGKDEEIELPAEIVARDTRLDLALLKIQPKEPLPSVVFAPPIDTDHGLEVTIIANPGLGNTVLKNTITTGVVSNPKQTIDDASYIQSSAAINPGSSGGPMFDENGKVIGMVVLKARIEGVGFAIPMSRIAEFLLRSSSCTGDDGRLSRAWVSADAATVHRGVFAGTDGKTLTIIDPDDGRSLSLDSAQLSGGDRALVELLRAATAK